MGRCDTAMVSLTVGRSRLWLRGNSSGLFAKESSTGCFNANSPCATPRLRRTIVQAAASTSNNQSIDKTLGYRPVFLAPPHVGRLSRGRANSRGQHARQTDEIEKRLVVRYDDRTYWAFGRSCAIPCHGCHAEEGRGRDDWTDRGETHLDGLVRAPTAAVQPGPSTEDGGGPLQRSLPVWGRQS